MQRAGVVVLTGFAASLVVAFLIALSLAKRIAEPLQEVANNAQLLPDGVMPPPIKTPLKELSDLGSALEATGRRLQTRDSELASANEQLRKHALELQTVDANKSRFLALLAHELRNPLAPLRTGLTLLGRTADPKRQEELRAMMERQVKNVSRLIEDLVDVSRIDRGQLELRRGRVTLDELVPAAVEVAKPGMEVRHQTLSIRYAPQPLHVSGDEVRLIQIIANLLNNASKYTGENGTIEISMVRDQASAVLRVTDSGMGFSNDEAERIFDMFVRLDEGRASHSGGLGIGLTIARALAREHRGDLVAYSPGLGLGATFTLTLPLEESGVETSDPVLSLPAVHPGSRRVLVADDNRDATDTTVEMLRCEGFAVERAYDGEQALEVAGAFRPEVAILDLDMPKLSGIEVATALRKQFGQGIFLVALTGLGREEDIELSKRSGFDAHLTKPADPMALLRLAADETSNVIPLHQPNSAR